MVGHNLHRALRGLWWAALLVSGLGCPGNYLEGSGRDLDDAGGSGQALLHEESGPADAGPTDP